MTEEARGFLDKADRTLRAAETLLREGHLESAAGRCYYAMLHAAQALLRERGLRYRKHSGVHTAYGEHFGRQGSWTASTTGGCWTPSVSGCVGTTTSTRPSTRPRWAHGWNRRGSSRRPPGGISSRAGSARGRTRPGGTG
ncbi:MAG: HEPN domain-containing protein [Candidatus Latescibacterota bacterium]